MSDTRRRHSGSGFGTVLFLQPRDVLGSVGGSESLIRTNLLLARRRGFSTHLLGALPKSAASTLSPEFGPITTVANPLRFVGRRSTPRSIDLAALSNVTRRAALSICRDLPRDEPIIIDSCSIAVDIAVAVRDRLRREGRNVSVVGRFYCTILDEMRAKHEGTRAFHGVRARMSTSFELAMARLVLDPAERRGFQNCDVAVSNYRQLLPLLFDEFGHRRDIRTMPYTSGLAPAAASPRVGRTPNSPLRIVAVSRHDPRKGVDVLLEALAELQRRSVSFEARLVGPGALLDAHRKLSHHLGLDANVTIPGRVDDIDAEYRWADVFVLPSHEEHSGSLSLIEAARWGCALISTEDGSLAEDLSEPTDGMLVAPGQPVALADAFERCAVQPAFLGDLQRGARALFLRRFDPDVAADEQQALYEELGVHPRMPVQI